MSEKAVSNDFTQGSVYRMILGMSIPYMMAQIVNVLYNIVDRVYIGMTPENATLSLTGLGRTLPVISAISAFSNLFGTGGAPLCSIARGKKDINEAEAIIGNSFAMLVTAGIVLTVLGLIFKRPLLYAFGASDATFPYANDYLTIYLCGSVFVMISLGMNNYINSQGFPRVGMLSVCLGAVCNIILDPIFIFGLGMGVRGAALATVISQAAAAAWILRFLTGKRCILKLRLKNMRLKARRARNICMMGTAGFVMAATNSVVQVVCNATLQTYGGDLYVGVMTVFNSIREILQLPACGITDGSQPFLGYNYGAGAYGRVKKAVKFITIASVSYLAVVWFFIYQFPEFFIRIFNRDPELIQAAVPALHIQFMGFFFMAFQFSGQAVFVGLGKSKNAIFFSLLRKVVIVTPLILFLSSVMGLGVNGVFMAEPISNLIGGLACYFTMLAVVWPELSGKRKETYRLS